MSSSSDKTTKVSRLLRQKAQEFLVSKKNTDKIVEIAKYFNNGGDPTPCIQALSLIFTSLLKNGDMYVEIVPLKGFVDTQENRQKDWLKNVYEECCGKILEQFDHENERVQTHALMTMLNFVSYEGKHPLESVTNRHNYVPLTRLKTILIKLLSTNKINSALIDKLEESLEFDDILFHIWRTLPSLTAKTNPNDTYIMNYLLLLHKLHVSKNKEGKLLCCEEFQYDEKLVRKSLNKIWGHVMVWEHTKATHKQLLIVLLENVMNYLDKPLLLTDFLMDSLDVGGPVSLLALQGIFTLIQVHNLDYPNIYGKLYSMFEPEIFHMKYKARLFYLSDLFLSSSHLPENLVAAFVKRLARLALVAPPEDILIICMFIGNLILRHPGLKCLLNSSASAATCDPFIMDERDPLKSNAINSSLWELKTLQSHSIPNVADAAKFINSPLPSVEWDMGSILENTSDDIFDKEIKKNRNIIALQFEKPNCSRTERISKYWDC